MDMLALIIVIVVALVFDFTNGLHDTANTIASSISTRAIPPKFAILMAASLDFVGAFLSIKVAETVGKGIVETGLVTQEIVFAGLVGAITWNVITWRFGLPSSSSHALIGGIVGAMLIAAGFKGINWSGLLQKIILPGFFAPVIAFLLAGIFIFILYRIFWKVKPGIADKGFRLGQLPTSFLLALSHGMNDAQKTMGVITLALVANGLIDPNHFYVPTWVIVASASAIALGTYTGGWRIIKTIGSRIIKMDPSQGFSAQGTGALIIIGSSQLGFPLSTTHVISSAIMGSGAAKRISAVRWNVAGNIFLGWLMTLPASAIVGALTYFIVNLVGGGAIGLATVGLIIGISLIFLFFHKSRTSSGNL